MTTSTTSTPTVPAPDLGAIVTRYLAAWKETDPTARRTAFQRVFADRARHADPLADVSGHDGIDAVIAGAQAQFPGLVFSPQGAVDGHHCHMRFGWGLGPEGAEPLVLGWDVALVDDEGRIDLVLGLLDRVPA